MEKRYTALNDESYVQDITPHSSSFEASDREQSLLRLALPLGALLWSVQNPADSPAIIEIAETELRLDSLVAGSYFLVAMIVYASWHLLYRLRPDRAHFLRKISLVSDVSAISTYSAVSGSGAVILLPIYLSAIIGYGMRFGRPYLLAALFLSGLEFFFVIRINEYFVSNTAIVLTYVLAMAFLPTYTLVLLKKYSAVVAAYARAVKDLDQFVKTMSHEFRAPLHSIVSIAEFCDFTLSKAPLTPTQSKILQSVTQDVLRCAERMLSVANRIAIPNIPRAVEVREETKRSPLFRDVFLSTRICAVHATRKALPFRWSIAGDCPCFTEIDSTLLQEILINLIDNSVKNTTEGEVCLHVKFHPETKDSGLLKITVSDTGSGFSTEQANQSFFVTPANSLIDRKGAGIGIALIRQQISALSGTMEIRSHPNGGQTCIEVTLPVCDFKFHPPQPAHWLHAIVITDRALTNDEQIALCEAKLFPRVISKKHGLLTIASHENFELCICLGDQYHALKEIQNESIWTALSSAPVVLLVQSPCDRETTEQFRPNFQASALRVDPRSMLINIRTAIHSDFGDLAGRQHTGAPNASVLLMDDSELTAFGTQRMLEAVGFRCTPSLSIESALEALNANEFDVIICDRYIGTCDLLEEHLSQGRLASELTKLILVSADACTARDVQLKGLGVRSVLVKPLSTKRIIDAIEDVLAATAQSARPFNVTNHSEIINWDLFGEYTEALGSREVADILVTKFENEMLADCLDCGMKLMSEDRVGSASILHKMEGVATLLGAVRLASSIGDLRIGVLSSGSSVALLNRTLTLDEEILSFTRECRTRKY